MLSLGPLCFCYLPQQAPPSPCLTARYQPQTVPTYARGAQLPLSLGGGQGQTGSSLGIEGPPRFAFSHWELSSAPNGPGGAGPAS